MGTMSRQREALIQNGLTADAGDVDAEFDHIVAQHNESEVRLVAAEAAIATNAGDISDATEASAAGQETYSTASNYTYLISDERQFVVTAASLVRITLPDPEGANLRTAGERFQIICATDAGCEVYSAYFQNAIDANREVYLRNGDILEVVAIDNGVNTRYFGNVLRSQRDYHGVLYKVGAGGTVTLAKDNLPKYIVLQCENGSAITVTLPTLDDWWIGRKIHIMNIGAQCSLAFDATNDAIFDPFTNTNGHITTSPVGLPVLKDVVIIGLPEVKIGDTSFITRRCWKVIDPSAVLD